MGDELTWFWEIVDRNGFDEVPSDERAALSMLVRQRNALLEDRNRLQRLMDEDMVTGEVEIKDVKGIFKDLATLRMECAKLTEERDKATAAFGMFLVLHEAAEKQRKKSEDVELTRLRELKDEARTVVDYAATCLLDLHRKLKGKGKGDE